MLAHNLPSARWSQFYPTAICARGCVVDMDLDLLEELSEMDAVVAIKNSTPNLAMFLNGAYRLRGKVRYFNMPSTPLGADLIMQGVSDGSYISSVGHMVVRPADDGRMRLP